LHGVLGRLLPAVLATIGFRPSAMGEEDVKNASGTQFPVGNQDK